jgi:hypothetical protein
MSSLLFDKQQSRARDSSDELIEIVFDFPGEAAVVESVRPPGLRVFYEQPHFTD